MESISVYIAPLVIHSLGGGHTHTDVCTETILRNQVSAGLWLAHIWFKNSSLLACNGGPVILTKDWSIIYSKECTL